MPVREFKRPDGSNAGRGEMMAATRMDVTDPGQFIKLQAVHTASKVRTPRAWKWYNEIGEVHYALNRSARVIGHAELLPFKRQGLQLLERSMEPGHIEAVSQLWSPNGGQRRLIEQFYVLSRVHGQAHLIRSPRNDDGSHGGFEFLSDEELTFEGEKILRTTLPMSSLSGLNGVSQEDLKRATSVEVKAEDYIGRVWRPHPQFSDLPDSPMFALDGVLEELHLLTQGVKARLLSRLALAGILFLPSEISEASQTAQVGEDQGPMHTDKVINALITTMMANVTRHDDASAVFPIILRGPGEWADKIRHIVMDREVFETDMRLRAEALERILMGLDVMPEGVKGYGESNHWNAWASRDEDMKANMAPDLEMLCWTLEQLVFLPDGTMDNKLLDEFGLWYDMSGAIARPNLAEDAKQGIDNGTVSGQGYRELAGIDEEFALKGDELVRWTGVKLGDPYLATFGLPEQAQFDWEKIGSKKSGNEEPGRDPKAPGGKVSSARPGSDGTTGRTDSNTPKRKRAA